MVNLKPHYKEKVKDWRLYLKWFTVVNDNDVQVGELLQEKAGKIAMC